MFFCEYPTLSYHLKAVSYVIWCFLLCFSEIPFTIDCSFYGANEFAFGMMWGAHGVRDLSVLRIEDVRIAVDKAYIDMTPRTIKGLGLKFSTTKGNKKDLMKLKQSEINFVKDWLAEKLIEVFNDNSPFDDLKHEELCKGFIDTFQKAVNKINQKIKSCSPSGETIDPNQITYGKAQKIVNMSFKYLYFFEGAFCDSDVFDGCHMAIDENILTWFMKHDKVHKSIYDVTWSNMNKDQYFNIQKEIKSYCNKNAKEIENIYKHTFPAIYNCVSSSIASNFAKVDKPFYAEFYIFDLAVNG